MILSINEGKILKKTRAWWMKKKIDAKLKNKRVYNRYKSPAIQEKIKRGIRTMAEMIGGL